MLSIQSQFKSGINMKSVSLYLNWIKKNTAGAAFHAVFYRELKWNQNFWVLFQKYYRSSSTIVYSIFLFLLTFD